MLGREGTRRKIELHVALFLVLLSPGYNPPRRRRCLYLSRGKPPSVCAYLSLPPIPAALRVALRFAPVPPYSQSTFWQLTLVPPSSPRPLTTPARLLTLPSIPARPSALLARFALPPQSPTYSLFSLLYHPLPPPDFTHLRPPDTHPLAPSYPSFPPPSTLYPCSTVPARSRSPPPSSSLPSSGAPTHPNANHPLKVGAPYWRLNHPARGRVEGEGMGREGRRGGRVAD